MVYKGVLFCAFACLFELSMAGPYQLPKRPCGCGSGKSITKIKEIEEISYKPSYSGNCVSIEIPSNGGAFAVTSIGPIAPSGITVTSDLALGGDLVLSGVLPYLSAVAFEGELASNGAAPVAYSCGDLVAITEQIGGNIGGNIGGSIVGNIGGNICGNFGGNIGAGAYSLGGHGCGCGCKY